MHSPRINSCALDRRQSSVWDDLYSPEVDQGSHIDTYMEDLVTLKLNKYIPRLNIELKCEIPFLLLCYNKGDTILL